MQRLSNYTSSIKWFAALSRQVYRAFNINFRITKEAIMNKIQSRSSSIAKTSFNIFAMLTLLFSSTVFAQWGKVELTIRDAGKGLYSAVDLKGEYSSGFWIADKGVVVFDPTSAAFSEVMYKEIRTLTDKPIKYVIYSHNHWDHISGAAIFAKHGAQIVAHADGIEHLMPNKNVVQPTLTWSGNKAILALGDLSIELLYFGANHGHGMTVTRIPSLNAVFVSDLVVAKRVGYLTLPDFKPTAWINSLEEINKLDFDILLTSHDFGGGSVLGHDSVMEQQKYLKDLIAAVNASFKEGASMETLGKHVKTHMQEYKDWAKFDEWIELNAYRIVMEMGIGY